MKTNQIDIREMIKDNVITLSKKQARPILAFININTNRVVTKMIDMRRFYALKTMLGAQIYPKLGALIHTYGGDAIASLNIANMLRNQADDLDGYVPAHAFSGGTHIVLACDTIFMSDYSNLGPLDTQYPKLSSKEGHLSSLAIFKGIEESRKFAIDAMKAVFPEIRTITDNSLEPMDEVKAASEFATDLTSKLFQTAANDVGEHRRSLLAVDDQIASILSRNPYYDKPDSMEPDMERINNIIEKLVFSYHDHGQPIQAPEAISMGLPVEMVTDDLCEIFDSLNALISNLSEDYSFMVDPKNNLYASIDSEFIVNREPLVQKRK